MENKEKCTKNYKYTKSIGNLNSHIIKYDIILPFKNSETKSKSAQLTYEYEQKEIEESLL